MSLTGGMLVLRAMVLGWLDGLFTSIHERVLYPSHRLGGEGNVHLRGRKPPPPLFYSVATGFPRSPFVGNPILRESPGHCGTRRRCARIGRTAPCGDIASPIIDCVCGCLLREPADKDREH